MAYMDFSAAPALLRDTVAVARKTAQTLTALEWSVVALARRDSLGSLRRPGRLSVALGGVFGTRHNPRLADEKLEALRRMAVLAWHRGYVIAKSELQAFLAAGFSMDQYEAMMASISVAKMGPDARRAA
jgi:hypothetical protein